jgi:uncharacterized SAM-binding protein YcdF (DUF218 family)
MSTPNLLLPEFPQLLLNNILNSFFYSLCNPIVQFAILLVISAAFKFFKKQKIAVSFFSLAIFWMFLISTTPFSQWMIYRLENRFSAFDPKTIQGDSSVYILVLGGGHTNAPDLPPGSQLSASAMMRLTEGIRLHRQIPGSKIVCSGYSASKRTSQAEMLANTAVDLGVNPADTVQSRSPENTAAEIRAYKNRFGNSVTLIIVTSAYHLPRAMALCEKNGLTAFPAPTDFYIKHDLLRSDFDFYPYALKILMLENALHEYAGLLKVKWTE